MPNPRPFDKAAPKVARGAELYETPPAATRALIAVDPWLQTPRRLWEPACGPGAMVSVLRAAGHEVHGFDLQDYTARLEAGMRYDYHWGVDFLKVDNPHWRAAAQWVDAIVTNPPFSLATQFVERALALAPRAYFLMRLNWLEGGAKDPGRDRLLDGGHLTGLFPFRERVQFHRDGWTGPKHNTPWVCAWLRFEAAPPSTPGSSARVRNGAVMMDFRRCSMEGLT